jgi:hypothetical protein
VGTVTGKLIAAMMYPVMGVIAHIYQPVIASPAIAMNDTFNGYLSPNNVLERLFACIRDNFGIYFSLTFKNTEYDGFTRSTTPSLAWDSARTKVGFIYFYGSCKGSFLPNPLAYFVPKQPIDVGYRTPGNPCELAVSVAVKSMAK